MTQKMSLIRQTRPYTVHRNKPYTVLGKQIWNQKYVFLFLPTSPGPTARPTKGIGHVRTETALRVLVDLWEERRGIVRWRVSRFFSRIYRISEVRKSKEGLLYLRPKRPWWVFVYRSGCDPLTRKDFDMGTDGRGYRYQTFSLPKLFVTRITNATVVCGDGGRDP